MSQQTSEPTDEARQAGIDRSHASSPLTKAAFCLLHLGIVVLVAAAVWGGLLATLGGWIGQSWTVDDLPRAQLIFGAALLYWVRHCVTLFYLLVRKVEWGEVLGLSLFILLFELGLCVVGAGALRGEAVPLGPVDGAAIALILVGSFLNTGSEVQRKWWKRDPQNKGRCYTGGLFAWSMHINYFGDTVLFTGWCLLSASGWFLLLPLLMATSFVFFHIPGLDAYLEERYGDEFIAYAKTTRKFIPFVY